MADTEDVEHARRELGQRLAQLRKASGYSQHVLAPLTHYGRSTIANVEIGRQNVPRAFWLRCEQLLSANGVLLAAFEELEAARRSNLRAQVLVSAALPAPRQVNLVTVAQLADRVRDLGVAYDVTPSVSLLTPAARCQADIMALHPHAPAGVVRHALYSVSAKASILMGQLVWDASQRRDHATTVQYLDQAVSLAQQVQDPVLEAHATLRQSYVALYGHPAPQRGLDLATRASQLAGTTAPSLAGLALLHVAEAEAMLGERAACERALGEAEQHFELRTELDVATNCYSPTQSGRLAGSCYLSLNMPHRAAAILAGTICELAAEDKVNGIIFGNLSLAYLREGQIDQAVGSLHQAIDTLATTRGGGGLNVVFAAGRELRPWRATPVVQELHDRMLDLLAIA